MKKSYKSTIVGEEKRSISGGYTVQEENILLYKDRKVFYVRGSACLDSSCCGSGNWNYIQVIGYLLNEDKEDENKSLQSWEADTIEDRDEQIAISKILTEKHPGARIEFH